MPAAQRRLLMHRHLLMLPLIRVRCRERSATMRVRVDRHAALSQDHAALSFDLLRLRKPLHRPGVEFAAGRRLRMHAAEAARRCASRS